MTILTGVFCLFFFSFFFCSFPNPNHIQGPQLDDEKEKIGYEMAQEE